MNHQASVQQYFRGSACNNADYLRWHEKGRVRCGYTWRLPHQRLEKSGTLGGIGSGSCKSGRAKCNAKLRAQSFKLARGSERRRLTTLDFEARAYISEGIASHYLLRFARQINFGF